MQIGEIAAAAAGNQDLLADSLGVFQQRNPPPATASSQGAHQAGCAAAQNQHVVFVNHTTVSGFELQFSSARRSPSPAQRNLL